MFLPPGKRAAGSEWLCACPFCEKHDKFYWNIDKEVGWCHSCHRKIVGHLQLSRAFGGLEEVPLSLPKQGKRLTDVPSLVPASSHKTSSAYLTKRWVSVELSLISNLSFSLQSEELYVPIHPLCQPYPKAWMRRNLKYGGWRASDGMQKAHYAYGHEAIPAHRREVVLVEGVFDVLSPGLYGYAVAVLGAYLSGTQLAYLVNRFETFLLWMDPDKAGRVASRKISKQLQLHGKTVVDVAIGVEPGDIGPDHPTAQDIRRTIDDFSTVDNTDNGRCHLQLVPPSDGAGGVHSSVEPVERYEGENHPNPDEGAEVSLS